MSYNFEEEEGFDSFDMGDKDDDLLDVDLDDEKLDDEDLDLNDPEDDFH